MLYVSIRITAGGLFFEHDFGGFDDGRDGVADFELHFVGAFFGDDAFDEIFADAHDDVGHDAAELELDDFALQAVASGERHEVRIAGAIGFVHCFWRAKAGDMSNEGGPSEQSNQVGSFRRIAKPDQQGRQVWPVGFRDSHEP